MRRTPPQGCPWFLAATQEWVAVRPYGPRSGGSTGYRWNLGLVLCGATLGWHTDRMTRRSVLVSLSVGAMSAVLIAFITGDRPLEALAGGLVVASLGAAIAR